MRSVSSPTTRAGRRRLVRLTCSATVLAAGALPLALATAPSAGASVAGNGHPARAARAAKDTSLAKDTGTASTADAAKHAGAAKDSDAFKVTGTARAAGSGKAADAPTAPPPVTILTPSADRRGGDIFIAPFDSTGTYANGAEILSPKGDVVWFHPAPAGQEVSDFRTQLYRGQKVLTFWQGTGFGGLSTGTDYIFNNRFQQIATVQAGNGLSADGHEFLITPQNTALIVAYTTATADLTSIGGPADQTVIDGVVQEIDIRTGKVLFQWNPADHVRFSQSEQPLPASASTPWDWFHLNAVHLTQDGDLLINGRHTWTAYKVNRRTGAIIWQLGGKDSSFTLRTARGQVLDNAGEIFSWEHDSEQVSKNEFTFFDNDSAGTPNLPFSRVVVVRVNQRTKTATLIRSYDQPEGMSAASQGNGQTLRDGDVFVGWGALPFFSEFSKSGKLLFNAQFPAGVNSYRAYRLPWTGSGDSQHGRGRQHRRD